MHVTHKILRHNRITLEIGRTDKKKLLLFICKFLKNIARFTMQNCIQPYTFYIRSLYLQQPYLVVLLLALACAPQSHCIAATKTLEKMYRPAHPCFCAKITDSLDSSNPPSLHLCHQIRLHFLVDYRNIYCRRSRSAELYEREMRSLLYFVFVPIAILYPSFSIPFTGSLQTLSISLRRMLLCVYFRYVHLV